MDKIQFLKLNFDSKLNERINQCFKRVNDSGHYILGPEVLNFETKFAEFCGVKHCLGISNGLDALFLALKALDLRPTDAVAVPANTFIATWLGVSEIGAKLIPIDAEERTGQMDPALLEEALRSNPDIKCVIVVHLNGIMGQIEKIQDLCRTYKTYLIEDAAQSHGSVLKGKKAGAWGDLGVFSFYPGKNLGALGDAGAVVTNNTDFFEKIKKLRSYGSTKKYHHDVMGFNRRMDEVQAAILSEKLKHLDNWNDIRAAQVKQYREALNGIGDLQFFDSDAEMTSWHLCVVLTKTRDTLQKYLAEQQIETLVHYPIACHLSKAYENLGFSVGDFPISEKIADSCLSLPLGPHLTSSQINHVANAVVNYFK